MHQGSDAIEKVRRELIKQTLEKIIKTNNFRYLKSSKYDTFAHLWLHMKAEKEGLFDLDEWSYPECREALVENI